MWGRGGEQARWGREGTAWVAKFLGIGDFAVESWVGRQGEAAGPCLLAFIHSINIT